MKGEEFGGLGLEVMQDRRPRPRRQPDRRHAGGARRADVRRLITAIDDTPVKGLTLKEAVDRMRGPAKTSVSSACSARRQVDARVHHRARDHQRAAGAGAGRRRRRYRLHPHHPVQPGDLRRRCRRRWRVSATIPARTRSRATSSICATIPAACSPNRSRSSTPSSTTARSSRPAGASLDQQQEYYARSGGDLSQQQAAGRADQRRLGLGLGDRLRRAAGPQARDADRHALVRQGFGADGAAARRRRRAEADDGALLHAVGPFDPGQGHRAGHQGAAKPFPTTSRARSTARARPRSPAI